MARTLAYDEVIIHPEGLEIQPESQDSAEHPNASALGEWIHTEVFRADSARAGLARMLEEALRLYEGVPAQKTLDFPIENAPNLVITLGAIATDAIYAQILNLIFNVSPLITVSPVDESGKWTEHAKALQRFIEVAGRGSMGLREAANHAILDDVKLGTGIYYIRWFEKIKRTALEVVTDFGARIRGVPVEDFFIAPGSYDDLQNSRWVAVRHWLTRHELELRARDFKWDIDGVSPYHTLDMIRQTRVLMGRETAAFSSPSDSPNDMYEVFDVWCHYDIDDDGIDEDLLVIWDRGSRRILKWMYNPYDIRPFEAMRYQVRAYLFYGIGVVEMLAPFQKGATDLYNHWVLNSLLANTRFWVGRHGAVPGNQLRIWPNRYLPVQDPRNDIQAIAMGEVYPSGPAALATTVSFAERRSGINDLTAPRPSAVLGSRTPGITALSLLQKSNERFGPAFDSARHAAAGAVRQAVMRWQEQVLAGNQRAISWIQRTMGNERGALVLELLRDREFDNAVSVELTASTVSQNRETARQNSLILLQALMPYFERILQLQAIIENAQTPQGVKAVASRVSDAAAEAVERTVRTFDEVRDPRALVVRINEQVDQATGGIEGLEQLLGMLQGMDQTEAAAGRGGGVGGDDIGFISPPVG